MKSILTTYQFYRAGWVKSHLEANGIPAFINHRNADLIAVHMINPYEIMVDDAFEEEALALLDELNFEELD